ncbi:hypothetical protein GW17_00022160 [Ensete ventricosum]|nr:hypothetical protein GW17_00022160 [Ensete ventricosum]
MVPQKQRLWRLRSSQTPTPSSVLSRRATRPRQGSEGSNCPEARSSGSPSPEPS